MLSEVSIPHKTTLQDAIWSACEELLLRHTNPWDLDDALLDWGCVIGPCAAMDLVGLDRVIARRGNNGLPILERMVAEGRIGKGGGVGFYRYPGGGGAVIDPLIEDLLCEEAWFAKIERHDLSQADLANRVVQAANLAIKKLDHGSLARRMTLLNAALIDPALECGRG